MLLRRIDVHIGEAPVAKDFRADLTMICAEQLLLDDADSYRLGGNAAPHFPVLRRVRVKQCDLAYVVKKSSKEALVGQPLVAGLNRHLFRHERVDDRVFPEELKESTQICSDKHVGGCHQQHETLYVLESQECYSHLQIRDLLLASVERTSQL